jgi:hypothetical protein
LLHPGTVSQFALAPAVLFAVRNQLPHHGEARGKLLVGLQHIRAS